MAELLSGQVTAFFLFDVAEGVDLPTVRSSVGASAESPRSRPSPAVPAYVQYQDPPVQFDAEAIGAADAGRPAGALQGVRLRRLLAVADAAVPRVLGRPPRPRAVHHFVAARSARRSGCAARRTNACSRRCTNPRRRSCRRTTSSTRSPASTARRRATRCSPRMATISRACCVARCEPLSAQERDEVLRHRLSYLASDLVVPSWNGAFVYDTESGLPGALEILEFANSQLLQFRYYDQRSTGTDADLRPAPEDAVVRAVDRTPLHRGRARAARALHRRQRADRPDGERAEAGRRRLRGAAARPRGRPARSRRRGRTRYGTS